MSKILIDEDILIIDVAIDMSRCTVCDEQGPFKTAINHTQECPVRMAFPTPISGFTAYLSFTGDDACRRVTVIGNELFPTVPRIPVRLDNGKVIAVNHLYVHKTWQAAHAHVISQLEKRIENCQETLEKARAELVTVSAKECPQDE